MTHQCGPAVTFPDRCFRCYAAPCKCPAGEGLNGPLPAWARAGKTTEPVVGGVLRDPETVWPGSFARQPDAVPVPVLRALTLHQPWAWAICHLDKRVENRTWAPPVPVGTRIAIHAGAVYDREAAHEIGHRFCDGQKLPRAVPQMAIVAVATLAGTTTDSQDPWFCGPVGWLLGDVVVLPRHVPCKGRQGLWTVPEVEAAEVWRQVADAQKATGP